MIWIVVLLQVLDGWTTKKALEKGAFEKNPIVAKLLESFGIKGLWFAKLVGIGAAFWLHFSGDPNKDLILGALAALYAYVVYNNWKLTK